MEWARAIAGHVAGMLPPCWTQDDLVGAAELRLLELAAKYDPSRGVTFRQYAQNSIYGACFNACRRREYRASMGVPLTDYADPAPTPEDLAAQADNRWIWPLLLHIPARHALVVRRVYAEERPMEAIGRELGVCASRVSQLHTEALEMLRKLAEGRR